jgi:WD40 repeat protein
VWAADSGALEGTLIGHAGPLQDTGAFSPDSTRVVTADLAGAAIVWDVRSRQPVSLLAGHSREIRSVVFSPDSRRVVTASFDGTARVWEPRPDGAVLTIDGSLINPSRVRFTPDGARIVAAGPRGVAVWDAGDGRLITHLPRDMSRGRVAVDDRGRLVVPAGEGGDGELIGPDGAHIATLAGHTDHILAVDVTRDGRLVATGSADGTTRLWDGHTGRQLRVLAQQRGVVHAVAFDDAGDALAIGGEAGAASVWDVRTGQRVAELRGHDWDVYTVAFGVGGTRVITASHDQTARVWSRDGRLLSTVTGAAVLLGAVIASSDGSLAVTISSDSAAHVWDTDAGGVIYTYPHPTGQRCVAMSPTYDRMVTAGSDNVIRVWSTALEDRPPAQLDAYIRCKVPARLENNRLVRLHNLAACTD